MPLSRVAALLACLTFFVAFGGGGVVTLKETAGTLGSWWAARHWVPVSAWVVHADLRTVHDESTAYEAVARYTYRYRGRAYESTRVGLTGGEDHFGRWQLRQYARLANARRAGRPVTAWVDPTGPTRAVLDRDLRPARVASALCFGVLCTLVGLAAAWAGWFVARRPATADASPKVNPPRITSGDRDGMRALAGFALAWNLIAFPAATSALLDRPLWGPHTVALLFPLIGLALGSAVGWSWWQARRRGATVLALTPAQPTLGAPLTVRVTFEKPQGDARFALLLVSEHVDRRGEDTVTRVLWQQELQARAKGLSLTGQFSVPGDARASESERSQFVRWRVTLRWPDGHAQEFPLTVFTVRGGVSGSSFGAPGRAAASGPA